MTPPMKTSNSAMKPSRKTCRSGKHALTAQNTGEKGRCLDCKREYQREFMRAKRQREQLGDSISPASMRQTINRQWK